MTAMSLRLKVTRIVKELGQSMGAMPAPGIVSTPTEVPTFSIRTVSVDEKGTPLPGAQPSDIPVADETTLDGFTLGQIIDISAASASL